MSKYRFEPPRALQLRAPTYFEFGLLLLLGAMLGSSFVLMKASVASISVFMTVFIRLTIAAVALGLAARLLRKKMPSLQDRAFWGICFMLGIGANILPFGLITWAEIYIDTNLASLYMAVIPLFSLMMAHFLTGDERITGRKTLGLLSGFLGVFILLSDEFSALSALLLPQLACIFAAFCYAASRILSRRLAPFDPLVVSQAVTLCAVIMMAPFAITVLLPTLQNATNDSLLAAMLLGLFPTAIAFVILYHLIRTVGAVFQTSVNYLVPCFGFIWGYLIYAETPTTRMWLAMLLIFCGLRIAHKPHPSCARS